MSTEPKPTVILVHGAFADASSWSKVIPILEHDGYSVMAVQIPLTSLAEDIATTKRALDGQKGRVVLVGHSCGGAVITGAAAGNPNVKSLVYVAAFAPDANEPLAAAGQKFPAPPLNAALVPDSGGFLYVDHSKFHDNFCQDLPEAEARVMAATQKPLHNSAFGATVPEAAWKTIPTWYIVSSSDRDQSRPRTLLRETRRRKDDGDRFEPRAFPLPSEGGGEGHRGCRTVTEETRRSEPCDRA